MTLAGLPLFEPHSEPKPKHKGWREKQPTACARLRALLSDGKWHHMSELQEVAGYRYGGRLFDLRHGKDGGPKVTVQKEPIDGDTSNWRYRTVPREAVGP